MFQALDKEMKECIRVIGMELVEQGEKLAELEKQRVNEGDDKPVQLTSGLPEFRVIADLRKINMIYQEKISQ